MDGSKSYLQQKMEERMAEVEKARRESAASNGVPRAQTASTSLPTTGTGNKVKQPSPNRGKPVVNKARVGGAGRVQKPMALKGKGTRANYHKDSHVLEQLKLIAQESALVSVGAVSIDKQMEVQRSMVPKNLSPSPSVGSDTDKDQLPVNKVAVAGGAPHNQVAGRKRPAPDDNSTIDKEVSGSKRRKIPSSHQLPTSTHPAQDGKKHVSNPVQTCTGSPRTVTTAVQQDDKEKQRPPSPADGSNSSGIRLYIHNGRYQPVIYDSDDDFEEESPSAKGQRPTVESALVGISSNAVQEHAAQETAVASEPSSELKHNPSKRQRSEDDDSQSEQQRPLKIQKTDPDSDKENESQPSTEVYQHAPEARPFPRERSYRELMALAAKKQIEKGPSMAGLIVHKTTVPRPRSLSPVNNHNAREPIYKPKELKPIPKKPLTDAEYKVCENEAQEAKKALDALSALDHVRIRTQSGKTLWERSDRVRKTSQEKREMTMKEKKLQKVVDDFEEIKQEREDAQRKVATAARRGPAQTSRDKRKRTSTQTVSHLPQHP